MIGPTTLAQALARQVAERGAAEAFVAPGERHTWACLLYTSHLNGVSETSASFSVDPSVQQTMEQKIQESSAFLTSINMPIVVDQLGQKIGLGVAGPSASRTDTTTKSRETRDITALDPNGYQCVKTNFDTHLTYAKLDAWARHKAFQNMVRDAVLKRQGLDRIMVGWNGTHAAAVSYTHLRRDGRDGFAPESRRARGEPSALIFQEI